MPNTPKPYLIGLLTAAVFFMGEPSVQRLFTDVETGPLANVLWLVQVLVVLFGVVCAVQAVRTWRLQRVGV